MSLEFLPPSESAGAELAAGEVDYIFNPETQNSPLQCGALLFEDSYTMAVDGTARNASRMWLPTACIYVAMAPLSQPAQSQGGSTW